MDTQTALRNLTRLLCVNLENYSDEGIRKLVKKRFLNWHPDKNNGSTEHVEDLQLLRESYQVYNGAPSSSQNSEDSTGTRDGFFGSKSFTADDLFCDEEWDESFDTNSEYNESAYDDQFFHRSPRKNFNLPDYLNDFLRSESNRRAGKLFLLCCLSECKDKIDSFYHIEDSFSFNYFAYFITEYNDKQLLICVLFYFADMRITDLKKKFKKRNLSRFILKNAVKFDKLLIKLNEKCGPPVKEPRINAKTQKNPQPDKESKFNHRLLVEFCYDNNFDTVQDIMAHYEHLAYPCTYPHFTKEHEDDHNNHKFNAFHFIHMGDAKKTANNAMNWINAKNCLDLKNLTNTKYIENLCIEMGSKLLDETDCKLFGESEYYCFHIIPKVWFKKVFELILDSFINGEHKKRWIGIKGPYGEGKSTFANAIRDFLKGVVIDINIDKSRLHFFLGNVIGKRYVVLDDVKGQKSANNNLNLSWGVGFTNLDNMRTHLDGTMPVQLEKKNEKPINTVFPPGLITCNDYVIPDAVKERVQFFRFLSIKDNYKKHPIVVNKYTIFIGGVLLDLLPVEPDVRDHIIQLKQAWWRDHNGKCNCHLPVSMGGIISSLGITLGTLLAGLSAETVTTLVDAGIIELIDDEIVLYAAAGELIETSTEDTIIYGVYTLTNLGWSIGGTAVLLATSGVLGGITAGIISASSNSTPSPGSAPFAPTYGIIDFDCTLLDFLENGKCVQSRSKKSSKLRSRIRSVRKGRMLPNDTEGRNNRSRSNTIRKKKNSSLSSQVSKRRRIK